MIVVLNSITDELTNLQEDNKRTFTGQNSLQNQANNIESLLSDYYSSYNKLTIPNLNPIEKYRTQQMAILPDYIKVIFFFIF